MGTISIKIPDEFEQEIKNIEIDVAPELVASLRNEIIKILALKTIAAKSTLTEKDALELGKKLKMGRGAELKRRGFI